MRLNLQDYDHPYYCSGANYFNNEATCHYKTMTEFLDEREDDDVDLNLKQHELRLLLDKITQQQNQSTPPIGPTPDSPR